eukprot:scaffold299575_cov36-Tisochrysis_lutea.AAC.3
MGNPSSSKRFHIQLVYARTCSQGHRPSQRRARIVARQPAAKATRARLRLRAMLPQPMWMRVLLRYSRWPASPPCMPGATMM